MKIKITGTVVRVNPTEVRGNNFHVRAVHVLIDSDTDYPQTIQIELAGDRCAEGDKLINGQIVEFDCDIRGREWKDPKTDTIKVFNTIGCRRFTIVSQVNAPAPDVPLFQNAPAQTTQTTTNYADDLPF
jgi:hypothetical protein